jgi:hypothetical protein
VSVGSYDLGIHLRDVSEHLNDYGAVRIIGYERGGKSTLAEILVQELRQADTTVVHQNATSWLRGGRAGSADPAENATSVDPELTEAMSRLEQQDDSCWVVDDAEVLLAYATEDLLRSIGRKVMSRRFSMILIRNRFVHEHAGWFNGREAALFAELPTLLLEPLPEEAALRAAQTFYSGPYASFRADWLVAMSGGIPGLMSELAPFAPPLPNMPPGKSLAARAARRREELGLDRPMRSSLVSALQHRSLPPRPMLSEAAQAEIGSMEIVGMLHPRYAQRDDPFRSHFWHLVVGEVDPVSMPDELANAGLELEIIIRELGLGAQFAVAVGLENAAEGDLANAFACCVFCRQHSPELVNPLNSILAAVLGKVQLVKLLNRQVGTADPAQGSQEMATRLLSAVGLA